MSDLFSTDILGENLTVFTGGRDSLDFEPLTKLEEATITSVFNRQLGFINEISPQLASDLAPQLKAFIKAGGVAKAMFPGDKGIKYPGEVGSIVVDVLTPQNLFYAATPSGSLPCYNGYTDNTWNIDLTAGTEAYLLGGSGTYYKGSITDQAHSLAVIAQNGIAEIGTTPKGNYMQARTETMSKYTPYALQPLVDLPMGGDRPVYQYNTPGMFLLTHDLGTQLSMMPTTTGTSRIQMFGLVFYEYDLLNSMSEAYRT